MSSNISQMLRQYYGSNIRSGFGACLAHFLLHSPSLSTRIWRTAGGTSATRRKPGCDTDRKEWATTRLTSFLVSYVQAERFYFFICFLPSCLISYLFRCLVQQKGTSCVSAWAMSGCMCDVISEPKPFDRFFLNIFYARLSVIIIELIIY
jgi:hypothetical protein